MQAGSVHRSESRGGREGARIGIKLPSLWPLQACARIQGMASPVIVMGFEGSANKIGVGIVRDDGEILSNPRETYGGA